jgi:hypothetical protein
MFLFDDIAMSPFRGVLFLAKEIAKAAQQEQEKDRANLMAELSSLHLQLEKGEISEEEFDEREIYLLDRLEAADSQ